jgi:hypothetical protein
MVDQDRDASLRFIRDIMTEEEAVSSSSSFGRPMKEIPSRIGVSRINMKESATVGAVADEPADS